MKKHMDRRTFVLTAGAAALCAAAPAGALEVGGVPLGLQSYTFHNVRQGGFGGIDTIIEGMQALQNDLLELWAPHAEPFTLPVSYWAAWREGGDRQMPADKSAAQKDERRRMLRAWRTNTPQDYFAEVQTRLRLGHVRLFAYNYSFEPTMTDAEIDHGFMAAKALGVELITASSRPSMAQRVAPFAAKHRMTVAFHNHANLKDPDDVATPDSFRKVLRMSPHYRINLDVAHFTAAGFDAIAFLEEQHANVTNLHVHDRLANDGKSVPFGEGVSHADAVLKLVRDRGWKLPCFYELEYVGAGGRGVVAETRRELEYEKRVLRT